MKHFSLSLILGCLCAEAFAQTSFFPKNNAKNVCVDTHLVLKFNGAVAAGTSGKVRIYDVTAGEMVDSLDLSIPAGPTESRTYPADCDYTKVPYDYTRTFMATNRNTIPGTPSGTAELNPPCYQLNIIGGFTDAFHFRPVIAKGNTATIYPHNNMLEYGHTYRVSIDKDVIKTDGFTGISDWTFTVKDKAPVGNKVKVDANGKGDFCTVQGALDYVPDFSPTHYYIYIGKGDYEEIVYARNKTNVTIQGKGMKATRVHYANNEVFNPHPMTVKTNEWPGTFPYRRAAFALDNCKDITLRDLTIATDFKGQAEGLFMMGERYALQRVYVIGDGDAIQANGTIYMQDCKMDGGTDAFLSRGSIYAYHCQFRNDGGAFTWSRSTEGVRGLVFVECDFTTRNGKPVDFGRCPNNHGKGYPHAEMVLINCKAPSVIPQGWSAIGEETASYLEYNTRDMKGNLLPTDQRHPFSKMLDGVKDAGIIRSYSTPEFVLGGWKPDFAK